MSGSTPRTRRPDTTKSLCKRKTSPSPISTFLLSTELAMTKDSNSRIPIAGNKAPYAWERWVKLGAEAGSILMDLRDRPRVADWAALGARALGLAVKVHKEHRAATAGDPFDYFVCEGPAAPWVCVPEELVELLIEQLSMPQIVESHFDGDPTSSRVVLAKLGEHDVGWVAYADGSISEGPFVRAADADATWAALGERLWKRLGSPSAAFGQEGLVADHLGEDDTVEPGVQFLELEKRLGAFLDAGISRGVLFCGPPGTGKSTGIRYLARSLRLRSLRLDVGAFVTGFGNGYRSSNDTAGGIDTLVRVLRPEVVILDDLDRTLVSARLLEFLEYSKQTCKLLMASANRTSNFAGAALRPGRFDEVIRVEGLDEATLTRLLGEDTDLVDRMRKWPVAYVREYVQRREVLGSTIARAELDELAERLERTGEDDD
jgi:hypothetical protein